MINIMNELATTYEIIGNFSKSVEFNIKSLDFSKNLLELKKSIFGETDHEEIAKSLKGLAYVYENLGENEKSLEIY